MLTVALLIGITAILLGLILKTILTRHKLFSSINAAVPKGYPFFGVSLSYLRNPADFVNTSMKIFATFPDLFKTWFGPVLVVGVSKPEYAEIVLNSPVAYSKMQYMYKTLEVFAGKGLITAPVEIWKKHRKIINPAFNQRILNGYVDIFAEKCSIMVEKLKGHAGKGELDVNDLVYKCIMDVTCESMMGVKVNAQTTNSTYHQVFKRLLDIAALRMINVGYNLDIVFKLSSFNKENFKLLTNLFEFTEKVIETKQTQYQNQTENLESVVWKAEEYVSKCKTFSDLLIEETSFTKEEIKDEVITFILAGTDTTSTAVSFALLMIAIHSEIQDKILEEVLTVIGEEKNIEASDLPNLRYTEWVIKETLRLFPSVPFILRQIEDGDIQLEENIILPKGISVLFGILPMHRSAEYWPKPLEFNPERFSPEEVAKRHQFAYIPYSGGPRNCIGYRFAIMTMKTLIASILRKYKISTSYNSVEDVHLEANIVLKPKNGFKVSFECRK